MRIHDYGVTENEMNERDEKSVVRVNLHVRGEVILGSLWCLPKELLFMVSPNEKWSVWRMACSQN